FNIRRPPGLAQLPEIPAQRRKGVRVALHEHSQGCPTRQGLEAQRAGARVEVQHRSGRRSENVEDGLSNLGGGGARPSAARNNETPAPIEPAGQTHEGWSYRVLRRASNEVGT